MHSPQVPGKKKHTTEDPSTPNTQQLGMRRLLATQQGSPSGRTNFSFKKDFVKESMVVLGPERTFKLRNPFDPHALMASNDDSATRQRSLLSPDPLRPRSNDLQSVSESASYSLSSYEAIVRDAKKARQWPRNYWYFLIGALFSIGTGAVFGLYFGFFNDNPRVVTDYVYSGKFRVVEGDWFHPGLEKTGSAAFASKAKQYKSRLDSLFEKSSLKDIFHHTEVIGFEGEGQDLNVLFNLHYLDKKSADDAENMATIIIDKIYNPLVDNSKTDSKGRKGKAVNVFQGLIIDPTSVQIRELKDKTESSNSGSNTLTKFDGRFRTSSDPVECVPVSLDFCRHLSYNLTSSPNLLGHQRKYDHHRLHEAAPMLLESECSPYIQNVLCHQLEPPCDEAINGDPANPGPLPPCRSICMAALASCQSKLSQNLLESKNQFRHSSSDVVQDLSNLLRCDLFPIDDGLGYCSNDLSNNQMMNGIIYEMESTECVEYLQQNGYAHRICDGMMDCRDFSDEVDCNYCPEERLHCGVGAACIDFKQRCDGIVDCPNGSDERGCLTIAPDMDAANFVHQYFSEGFIIYTEGNHSGKVCVDSLHSSPLSMIKQQSFIDYFGRTACRSLSYKNLDKIEVRKDEKSLINHAHLPEPDNWRMPFLRAPCWNSHVLYLSCSDLECGVRPIHMHKDRPARDTTMIASAPGDWPWIAALIRNGSHACDGTLVDAEWLLTSSSCFEGQGQAHWVARFGSVRLSSDAPWEQERRITGMIKSPKRYTDLVLVKLESAVIFSDFVRPVCMAFDNLPWAAPSSRCLFLGWQKGGDSLHEVTSNIISSSKCDNVTSLCAHAASKEDSCQNDEFAGGPLLCQTSQGEPWFLVAVSTENRYCDANFFGHEERTYHGVSAIARWVLETLRNR